MLIILVLLLPSITAFPITSCGLCPAQSTCGLDANGQASCICNAGFGGQHCNILLCHSSLCLGTRSICENTMSGPVCHCEKDRAGTNCELIEGESHPWSRCANATYCEASFQNGKCDELCNTPHCLYDGNDCDEEESVDDYDDTVIPEGTVDTVPLPGKVVPRDEAVSAQHQLASIPFIMIVIVIACFLLIIIILISTRRVVKKAATVVRRPPSLPIPPTPQLTHTPQPQPNYYSDASIGYATIPSISQSVAQSRGSHYSGYYGYATGYATLPIVSHSQAESIASDYSRFA